MGVLTYCLLSQKSDAKLGEVLPTPLVEVKVVVTIDVAALLLGFFSMANLSVNFFSFSPLLWKMMDCCCVDFAYCLPKKTFKRYFECDDPPPPPPLFFTPPSFLNWRTLNPCCKMFGTYFANFFLSLVF